MLRRLLLVIALMLPALAAGAKEIVVQATDGALVAAIKSAQAGDILRLSSATYAGPLVIDKPLTLQGDDTVIAGAGTGSVITVIAPDVTLRGLTVIGSGSGGDGLDAGITLSKTATRAVVQDNRLLGNLVGIDVHGAGDALVARNTIEGRRDRRMNDRGNGIYVWNAPGTRVFGNDIRWGRDGIFANTSKRNEFRNNRFRDLRFGLHYMYVNDSIVSGNISRRNHLGFAIMNSDRVRITGNLSQGDRDHGIMMNNTNKSTITGNRIEAVAGKCVFIYNSHKNRFRGNLFQGCGIGVHFTAGSDGNEIAGNGFVGNRVQVKYVGSKWVDWSGNGAGNYWSDHAAFDLNGDGIADAPYRPNDIMDRILWTQPAARALLGSPAVQLIRWSQAAFPATLPGGVIDRAPLMRFEAPPGPVWKGIQ
jgi:nitrous oxidase accessory protein